MSALTFDKSELGNLEYSLQREMLATDRIGGYMSTTIVCCNTRRYHGLIVAPIDDSDRTYLLLSALDETIIQHDQTFNLALHRFKGAYEPRGHKYITDFEYTPTPTITYRVGGVILKKEMLWIHKRTQLMIRYTLVDAHSETRLRLRPFLAFRDKHALTHANLEADGHSYPAVNGVKCRLYGSFPWLYLQTSKPDTEFVPAPDWYYNFEYLQDIARGYEGHEDLMTTGYFETELKKGESIIFSASLDEMGSTKTIEEMFNASIARRTHKIDFESCLEHSARQFLIRRPGNRTEVISGYPWHGVSGRQTFIALPGITLWQNHKEDCLDALDTQVRAMHDGMFAGDFSAAAGADTPLWFFWTLQQLETQIGAAEVWKRYGDAMKQILEAYKKGIAGRVILNDNGLVWASSDEVPLSWMNAMIDGRAVTPRNGYQVEVNALWYNAVCYTLRLAGENGDKKFVKAWEKLPAKTAATFNELFRLADGYLADYVGAEGANQFIRPNMIIACGLPYKMIDEQTQLDVIRTVRQHLLTPKGLRTLSPRNPLYKGSQEGSPAERDFAGKNGSVWPWVLAFYVRACFDIDKEAYLPAASEIFENFNEDIQTYGIGSIGELYDADPPFAPRGAISQAWSVAALLDILHQIELHKPATPAKKTAKKAAAATSAKKAAKAAPKSETKAPKAPTKRSAAKKTATK
ncbi:MAG TPA: amylo-alpha-1,6-glucosidase [Candidatus Alistipes intestinipullorum]|nr:amylo-alpha-1,6-glucosidase [Candidatus Alistipes intestinipullorum]